MKSDGNNQHICDVNGMVINANIKFILTLSSGQIDIFSAVTGSKKSSFYFFKL